MSGFNIAPFFQFVKSVVTGQECHPETGKALFFVRSDKRFSPRCHQCGKVCKSVHSYHVRFVRDLKFANVKVWLKFSFRKLRCSVCGIKIEASEFVDPYFRITTRLARYIIHLCSIMTVHEVADHLDLDWKTVKGIEKVYLKEAYSYTDYRDLNIIAIEEIALKKGHRYLTVVIDWESGRIVWMGEGRSQETLDEFFRKMPKQARANILAVAMDMWQPYRKSVEQWCPQAVIVFDGFHVIAEFNRVIDKVRNEEYRKAADDDKQIFKGLKYLLTMNKDRLSDDRRVKLAVALDLNQNLSKIYVLKDYLKFIWKCTSEDKAGWLLDYWCELAYESLIEAVIKFAEKLQRHKQRIINHCRFPIDTGTLEGMNNTLKVLKRKHYGFHDTEYYILKAKATFNGCN